MHAFAKDNMTWDTHAAVSLWNSRSIGSDRIEPYENLDKTDLVSGGISRGRQRWR